MSVVAKSTMRVCVDGKWEDRETLPFCDDCGNRATVWAFEHIGPGGSDSYCVCLGCLRDAAQEIEVHEYKQRGAEPEAPSKDATVVDADEG